MRRPWVPGGGGRSASSALLAEGALEASEVADVAFDGVQQDGFLILPHPEVAEFAQRRATDPDRWLAGMNKIQRSVE